MAIRQILLVAHTHHDVGYTNSPRIIDRMHAGIVDRVIDLAADPDDGPDAFRWTFENARPVLNFLRRAEPARRDRLADLVHRGRLAVTGGYLNMTQLQSAFEYDAAYRWLEALRAQGIPPRTQQHGDVNGLSWGAVDQMRDAGITRLVMALNPDHGRPPFRQPSGFRWQGPTGRDVFVWLSTHYGFGEEWGIVDGDVELADERISAFVTDLDGRDDYRWSTAVVHAGNDNRWPTDRYLDVVRAWNARHPEIPMRTATMDEALDELERENGADLPVVCGEWADWWAHGHGSTAREVAVYREARTFARQAQSAHALARLRGQGKVPLAEVLGYRRGPVILRSAEEIAETVDHVDEQLQLYAEHTWGSWETYSKPHSTFSHSHHNAKSAFAYDAFDHARDLAIEGWYRAVYAGDDPASAEAPPADGRIVVVNGSERPRREIVDVEADGSRRERVVAEVPAFGVAVLPVTAPVLEGPEAESRERAAAGSAIDAGPYRVTVDPSLGGVVSLIRRADGREVVDTVAARASGALGAVVVEVVPEDSDHPMLTVSPKHFHPDHPGPDFVPHVSAGAGDVEVVRRGALTAISWSGSAPGIPEIRTTLTIADDLDDVDVDVWLSKPERFGPESVLVAFPFEVPDAGFLVETSGAVFRADDEQLPDTSKDWYSIQHAVGVAGTDGAGVLWGSRDAPLVQLGGVHTGRWARTLDVGGGHVNSWLMNNLHFTNFQARQEVTRSFRYRFRPADAIDAADVRVYGRDLLEPLQARHHRLPLPPARSAPLRVEPADRVIAELRPHGESGVAVMLRNVSAEPVTGRVLVDVPGWPSASTVEIAARGAVEVLLMPSPGDDAQDGTGAAAGS